MGRRIKRTLPGGQVETYAYNIGGLLTGKTDFNGYTTTYQYDLMNRLVAKVPDARRGELPVTYAYNELGLRTNMTDASGATAYAYDSRNRLVQKTKTWEGTSFTSSLFYAYDPNGNLTGIVSSDPNGANVSYEYDALNRLIAVNDAHLGRTAYNYDEVGNLQSYTYPNGVTSFYQYDSLNRLTNLTSSKLLTPIASYAYTVGPAGNRLTASETVSPNGMARTINHVYTYDDLYRLTGEDINVGGTSSTASLNYNYDPVGNRLTRQSTLAALFPQLFSYDPNDRLTSDVYDNNGNTLSGSAPGPGAAVGGPPNTLSCAYDFENRLTRATTADGKTIRIWYDGDGNRVKKTVTTPTNSVTTFYVVDDQNPTGYAQVLEEHVSLDYLPGQSGATTGQPSTLNSVYCYGHMLISQARLVGTSGPDVRWVASLYGYDGHNNVRYLTDLNGVVTDTYDYDAFGNLISCTGDTQNNHLYCGEQYDADLGLYYNRARYLNTDSGRFWTMDSFEGLPLEPISLHK